jgi:hypothetical protein
MKKFSATGLNPARFLVTSSVIFYTVNYEVIEEENGTRIRVESEEKVAVIVKGDEERIYLPEKGAEASTYYVEEYQGLAKTEEGYTVFHPGKVSEVEVFSK